MKSNVIGARWFLCFADNFFVNTSTNIFINLIDPSDAPITFHLQRFPVFLCFLNTLHVLWIRIALNETFENPYLKKLSLQCPPRWKTGAHFFFSSKSFMSIGSCSTVSQTWTLWFEFNITQLNAFRFLIHTDFHSIETVSVRPENRLLLFVTFLWNTI